LENQSAKGFECAIPCQSDYICGQRAETERDFFYASLLPITSKVRQKAGKSSCRNNNIPPLYMYYIHIP